MEIAVKVSLMPALLYRGDFPYSNGMEFFQSHGGDRVVVVFRVIILRC